MKQLLLVLLLLPTLAFAGHNYCVDMEQNPPVLQATYETRNTCEAAGFDWRWNPDSDANGYYDATEGGWNLNPVTNPSGARDAIGLGDSATLDVGTTTGTVAAGDDTRLSLGGIDIRQYSCTADGVANDTTCLSNAIAAAQSADLPLVIRPLANGNKVFLTDGHTFSAPIVLIGQNGATLKLRADNISATYEQILRFNTGAEKSLVKDLTLDGNRDNLLGAYAVGKYYAGIFITTTDIYLENLDITECAYSGIHSSNSAYSSNGIFKNIKVTESDQAFRLYEFDNGLMENFLASDINNGGWPYAPGAGWFILSDNVQVKNLKILNMSGDASVPESSPGVPNWTSALTIHDSTLNIDGMEIREKTDDILRYMGASIFTSKITGNNWTITGYAGTSLELSDNDLFELTGFNIDCGYEVNSVQTLTSSWGITLQSAGRYYGEDGSGQIMGSAFNRDTRFSNGVVQRCGGGVRVDSPNLYMTNVKVLGNTIYGLWFTDDYDTIGSFSSNGLTTDNASSVLSNMTIKYNGGPGIRMKQGRNIIISNSDISDNGQDTSLADALRGGIVDEAGGSVLTDIILSNVTASDRQVQNSYFGSVDYSVYNGAFTTATEFKVATDNIQEYFPGQKIALIDLCTGVGCLDLDADTTADDLRGWVVKVDPDYMMVRPEHSGTLNPVLVAATGTISTTAKAISGGTSLTTQIRGSFWLYANSEYRRVMAITSTTAGTLRAQFTADLSAASYQISKFEIREIPSQTYGISLTTAANVTVGPIEATGNTVSGVTVTNREAWFSPLDVAPGTGYVGDGSKYLADNGTWGDGGTGDVTGPATSTADAVAFWSDTTGGVLKDSEITRNSSGDLSYKVSSALKFYIHRDGRFLSGAQSLGTGGSRIMNSLSPTLVLTNTEADDTQKTFMLGSLTYDNNASPNFSTSLYSINNATENTLRWGGGTGGGVAATKHSFYAATNITTATGTEIAKITTAGFTLLSGGLILPAATEVDIDSGTDTTMGAIRDAAVFLQPVSAPATAATACTIGQWAFDASYLYRCTATNTWLRSAAATW